MLGKIKSAIEKADHFEVDDGSGKAFKVAKAALSPRLVDRVRKLYCGGKVERFDVGGVVADPADDLDPAARAEAEAFWGQLRGGSSTGDRLPALNEAFARGFGQRAFPAGQEPLAPPTETEASREIAGPPPGVVEATEARAPAPGVSLAEEYRVQQADKNRRLNRIPAGAPGSGAATPASALAGLVTGAAADERASLGTAAVPPPGGAPVEATTPAPPPAAPVDIAGEARAAGLEAARRIAEAGDAARRSLSERTAAEANARAAELDAARALVSAQDQAAARAESEAARMRDIYQRGENALRLQKEKLAAREKDLVDPEAMRIETGRVFARTDVAGLMIGAMMVGAAEAGLRRGSGTDAAMKVIGDAIDRDVLAQKVEKEGLRSSRFRAYEIAVGDANAAAQLLKSDQQLAASAAARQEAQRTQSDQGRLLLAKLSSDLSTQARKTAEDAVQMLTGQALAQQKAQAEAEGRVVTMRQAEAGLARGAAEIEASRRAEGRADEQLAIARARLGLDVRQQAAQERQQAAANALAVAKVRGDAIGDLALKKGLLGGALAPDEFAAVSDKKERETFVPVPQDDGSIAYRKALTDKDAEDLKKAFRAIEGALGDVSELNKYIDRPGYDAPTIRPGSEAKSHSAALQQNILTYIKDIKELGALTEADMGLVRPLLPDPQGWTTTAAQEAKQLDYLQQSFRLVRKLAMKNKLTTSAEERQAIEAQVAAEAEALKGGE